MNATLLKYKIAEKGDTQKTLADILNHSVVTTNRKVNGVVDFTASEINIIMRRYEMSPDEVVAIFLT